MVTDNSSVVVECDDPDSTLAFRICAEVTYVYTELTRADTQRRADIAIGPRPPRPSCRPRSPRARPPGRSRTSRCRSPSDVEQAALFDAGVEFVDAPRSVDQSWIVPTVQYGVAAFAFGLLITGVDLVVGRDPAPDRERSRGRRAPVGAPLVGQIEDHGSSSGVEAVATNLASVSVTAW